MAYVESRFWEIRTEWLAPCSEQNTYSASSEKEARDAARAALPTDAIDVRITASRLRKRYRVVFQDIYTVTTSAEVDSFSRRQAIDEAREHHEPPLLIDVLNKQEEQEASHTPRAFVEWDSTVEPSIEDVEEVD